MVHHSSVWPHPVSWFVCCRSPCALPTPPARPLQHNVRDWLRVIASNKDRSGEQQKRVLNFAFCKCMAERQGGSKCRPRYSYAAPALWLPAHRRQQHEQLPHSVLNGPPSCPPPPAVYELRYFNIADQAEEEEDEE